MENNDAQVPTPETAVHSMPQAQEADQSAALDSGDADETNGDLTVDVVSEALVAVATPPERRGPTLPGYRNMKRMQAEEKARLERGEMAEEELVSVVAKLSETVAAQQELVEAQGKQITVLTEALETAEKRMDGMDDDLVGLLKTE